MAGSKTGVSQKLIKPAISATNFYKEKHVCVSQTCEEAWCIQVWSWYLVLFACLSLLAAARAKLAAASALNAKALSVARSGVIVGVIVLPTSPAKNFRSGRIS